MKKLFHPILLCLLAFQLAKATTWVSVSAGFWNNSMIWAGGVVPPLSSSDTFNIKHPIAINGNLFFNAGAFLRIDSTGGLCGHNNITIKSGAKFIKYGILEIDSLLIPGGNVSMYATGAVTLTCYGILSNGGSLIISGCSLIVGPWFNCRYPEFQFMGIEEMNFDSDMKLFPNPVSVILNLKTETGETENSEIEITNYIGQTILKIPFENSIDVSKLSQGFYNLRIICSNRKIYISKFVKE